MSLQPEQQDSPKRIPWVRVFRLAVVCSVIIAVIYTAISISGQLKTSNFDFRQIHYGWWAAALASYILTMSYGWLFWHRVLIATGQTASYPKTMLAFFASQLGKYVPGKAMVVVIRTDMVRGDKVKTVPAAASVFVETLTWLFVGSAIGCLLLMVLFREHRLMLIPATILTLVSGGLTSPTVFRAVASRLSVVRGRHANEILEGLNYSTMAYGWVLMSLGWCFNGLSLWLVLKGMPGTGITIADYPLTLACVCLATVAGFVSLLPGGIGVRELVMIPMLGARFGSVTAVVAAIIIRLVWLTAELMTSGIIYVYTRHSRKIDLSHDENLRTDSRSG